MTQGGNLKNSIVRTLEVIGLSAIVFISWFLSDGLLNQIKLDHAFRKLAIQPEKIVVIAAEAPDRWGLVKQSATWGRANTVVLETLIAPIVNSGLLSRTEVYNANSEDGKWFWRLTPNANASVTATAYSGSKAFAHKFEIWRASDNAKTLELYFDNPANLRETEVLLKYRGKILAPLSFLGVDVITESYVFGAEGARKQVYTFTGGDVGAAGKMDRGRVILEEMDNGTILCVKSVLRLAASEDLCLDGTGSQEYYTLAYSQKLTDHKETTAKFGLKSGALDNSGVLCAITNPYNYGLFTESGLFVSDSNSTGSVPSNYPSATRVDALFAEFGGAGDGAFDDTVKVNVDTWSTSLDSTAAP
jgi:hypothetical protein